MESNSIYKIVINDTIGILNGLLKTHGCKKGCFLFRENMREYNNEIHNLFEIVYSTDGESISQVIVIQRYITPKDTELRIDDMYRQVYFDFIRNMAMYKDCNTKDKWGRDIELYSIQSLIKGKQYDTK